MRGGCAASKLLAGFRITHALFSPLDQPRLLESSAPLCVRCFGRNVPGRRREPAGPSCLYPTREGGVSPELFARYQRSAQALILMLMEMVINGISTRTVVHIIEELCSRDTLLVNDSLLNLYQPANLAAVVGRIHAKPQRVVGADAHGGRIEVARQRELAYGASHCDPPDVVQELRVPERAIRPHHHDDRRLAILCEGVVVEGAAGGHARDPSFVAIVAALGEPQRMVRPGRDTARTPPEELGGGGVWNCVMLPLGVIRPTWFPSRFREPHGPIRPCCQIPWLGSGRRLCGNGRRS